MKAGGKHITRKVVVYLEKFLIEIENIPTETDSKSLYELIRCYGEVNMLYTGTKAYIYGEIESEAVDRIEDIIADKGYGYETDRG